MELSEFKDYRHIIFPLYLQIDRKVNTWSYNKNHHIRKIGIFTRLDQMKPLNSFFAAFHLLRHKLENVELHIFGSGDPVDSGVQRIADIFNISEHVYFRGHQKNIKQTAIAEKLDIVWYQGYKNRPAGYAGFDICLTGIPQVFWDFSHEKKAAENDVYPLYKNLDSFVDKSIELLTNEDSSKKLSYLQFNDVINNRDIKRGINVLEAVFCDISLYTDRNESN